MRPDATLDERGLLGCFRYQRNVAVLHRDRALMPKRCGAGSSEVAGIFPGITNDRLDVVRQRAS